MHVDEKLTNETFPAEPEKATLEGKNKFVGFWLFLGGETVLFASLFGTYLALKNSTNGGPTSQEMFQMPLVFIMTMLLLTSSLTSVYAMYAYEAATENAKACHDKCEKHVTWFVP